jgi:hypothetical protein
MKINKNSEAQNYIESELKHKLLDIQHAHISKC